MADYSLEKFNRLLPGMQETYRYLTEAPSHAEFRLRADEVFNKTSFSEAFFVFSLASETAGLMVCLDLLSPKLPQLPLAKSPDFKDWQHGVITDHFNARSVAAFEQVVAQVMGGTAAQFVNRAIDDYCRISGADPVQLQKKMESLGFSIEEGIITHHSSLTDDRSESILRRARAARMAAP